MGRWKRLRTEELRGGHATLFGPLTFMRTCANASDIKRKLMQKVLYFAAFKSLHLVNSDLRIRIT